MNGGFRKSKGIIIELTSLLDVILIMLFWVMLNMSNTAADAEKKAQQQVDAANAKVEQAKDEAQKQIDTINEQNKEMRLQAENMQNALDGFSSGKMVTLEMKYEDGRDVIYVSQDSQQPKPVIVNSELPEKLKDALNSYGLDKDSIILAAFMYDGNNVLYRDVNTVQDTLSTIKGNYKNIYYTQVNTTK
ncbi:MAG: hypothetical protein IJ172_12985 [Ruminococcus sp.]|nr:hypothetical protein [Ruminococcus sp.]